MLSVTKTFFSLVSDLYRSMEAVTGCICEVVSYRSCDCEDCSESDEESFHGWFCSIFILYHMDGPGVYRSCASSSTGPSSKLVGDQLKAFADSVFAVAFVGVDEVFSEVV